MYIDLYLQIIIKIPGETLRCAVIAVNPSLENETDVTIGSPPPPPPTSHLPPATDSFSYNSFRENILHFSSFHSKNHSCCKKGNEMIDSTVI